MLEETKLIKDRFGFGYRDELIDLGSTVGMESTHRNSKPTIYGKLFEQQDDGSLIFKKRNTVTLGGSITALEKLSGQMAEYRTPTYNNLMNYHPLGSPQTAAQDWEDEKESRLFGFAVGIGGAPDTFGVVYTPDFKQTNISGIIPFRVNTKGTLDTPGILPGADNLEERIKYTGLMRDGANYYWYLKQFEKPVKVRTLWKNAPDLTKDGTEVLSDNDVANGPDGIGIESFIECTLRIDPADIRPYFEANGNIAMARYNTIALFTGRPHVMGDDKMGFTNIRIFSVVNFDNESVKLPKATTYVYRVYSSL